MGDEKIFSIGATSRIKGVTVKALRFYEKKGLFRPHHVDPSNKYRYYSLEQFISLDIIKAARDMDVSLKDLKAVMKKRDTGELMEVLAAHKESMERKIYALQRIVRKIDEVQLNIKNSVSAVSNPDIYFREIPERHIISAEYDGTTEPEKVSAIYSELDNKINTNNLISTYETGILFEPNEALEFHPARIFNAVTVDKTADIAPLSTIPPGKYICVCYNRENAQKQQAKIFRYLAENRLTPQRMVQVDLLNDVFEADSGYFELQVSAK